MSYGRLYENNDIRGMDLSFCWNCMKTLKIFKFSTEPLKREFVKFKFVIFYEILFDIKHLWIETNKKERKIDNMIF